MGEVSRQDIEDAVMANDFDYDQFVSLITKHIEVQVPDEYSVLVKKEQTDGTKEPFTESDDVLRRKLVEYVFTAIEELNKKEELPDEPAQVEVEPPEDWNVPNEKLGIPEPERIMMDHSSLEGKEPEIKIDLNLGSEESASSDEATAPMQGPEKEESVEVETPSQGVKDLPDAQVGLNDSEVTASDLPASTSAPPYADRKSHIIALVKESKWTLKQLVQIIDDKWGYAARGKSSKTRVSKTVRDLRDSKLVYEETNGVLMWRGE